MNLQADLILPAERRSPSVVNARLLTRIGMIVGPLIVIIIVAQAVVSTLALNSTLREAEAAFLATEPKKEQALKVLNLGKVNDAILSELKGWEAAASDWDAILLALQENVPEDLQFGTLRLTPQLVMNPEGAARIFTLSISGTAVGSRADQAVQDLQRFLLDSEELGKWVKSAEITRFAADSRDKRNRVFHIDGIFKPVVFK